MRVSDFSFDLPDELIAQEAAPRGESRLLALDRATGAYAMGVSAICRRCCEPGDLLVVNDTRVFAARLLGRRVPSGGAVECLLLGAADRARAGWLGAVRGARASRAEAEAGRARPLRGAECGAIDGEILERRFFGRRARAPDPGRTGRDLDALVDAIGHVPLPPYIKRGDAAADRERYQTVYARERGSVAAPTAGLHFTPGAARRDRRARRRSASPVTLHVGYGTFKPVRVRPSSRSTSSIPSRTRSGKPPRRRSRAPAATAAASIAVGTTTTRALEDAARRGGGVVRPGRAQADIFIYPGFRFQVIDGLLTNFHLPQSSLLMLVAAFAGRERVLAAYREAVRERYRFYSYGDAMLVL